MHLLPAQTQDCNVILPKFKQAWEEEPGQLKMCQNVWQLHVEKKNIYIYV